MIKVEEKVNFKKKKAKRKREAPSLPHFCLLPFDFLSVFLYPNRRMAVQA
jgi:hypothetical protein